MSFRPLLPVVAAVAVALAAAPQVLAAQQVDVVRGRVTGPDSLAIENVVVTVTSIAGNVNRTARTDKNGRFTVTFPNGEGDYMVSFAAVGFAARRFEVKRTADQEILVADARLQRVGAVLDAVRVAAQRDRVNRNDAQRPDVSGTERVIENQAALPAADLGDLAAMAASLPGFNLVPGEDGGAGGYSAFGLGTDQNNTTLNGMQFGMGGNIPRDAAVRSSVMTSPYDVSRGGFSGAQMSLSTRAGTNFLTRGMSLNVDAPQLQWTDRAARALGQEYTNASLGGSLSGPLVFDKAFYNVAYQLGRRQNDLQSLLNTDAFGLQAAGVSADSVSRLLDLVRQAQIPASAGGLPGNRVSDQGSLFGSFDLTPRSSTSGQSFGLAFNGFWGKQNPATGLTNELPSHSGDRTNWNAGVQARHSNYYGFGVLSETSAGLTLARNYASPYLDLPDGRVRVNSTFADGTSGVRMLSFGGNQSMYASQRTATAALMNQLSWFSANNKHRLKFTSELRHEANTQDQTNNLLGTFTYNSLEDLQANRPASFSRQLAPRQRETGQLVAGLALGDAWRPKPDVQVQYGVRLDANRFLDAPARNAEVERAFGGARNDRVPNNIFVSPRVGFSWTYGTAAQVAAFEGAMRGPRAVVRGGVGLFQNTPGATLVGQAIDNTGLPGAVQQLVCVGPAAPTPDWSAYADNPAAVPDRCADPSAGSGQAPNGSVFANAAPNVTLFAKDYAAQRSVRSNLQWNGPVLNNRLSATVEGTYSANLNQPSFVDLNFSPATSFALGDEGRPVFVLPTSIVPATGAIASRDARVSPLFQRVAEQRSDLRSESRQLRFSVAPVRFSTGFSWNASYVYSNVREQFRGFGSTAGDPNAVGWSRGSFDARHQLTYTLGYNFFDFVRVSWFGRFESGRPFTPTVAGDVNGDGYANDRAFVFDPAAAGADPAVAQGIQSLLTSGSDAARTCLTKQVGRIAGRNSCQGPWTSNATLSFSFNPLKVRMPQRATLSFQLSNPLGAADLLLHGENDLRGWGQFAFPDQSLLYVRGFDPASKRYKYEVNQRFGATNPQFSAIRSPVTLTAMVRLDVAPTRERQMLTQQLDRGRRTQGQKAAEPMLKAMYGTGGVPNPVATILRQQDSLKLSAAQADSLASMNRRYTVKLDSIWSPVAAYLAALPNNYAHDEAYDRYRTARRASVDMLIALSPTIKGLLTAEQIRKLPPFVASYLDTRYLASIRSGTAGGGGMMMMPGMMMGGGAMVGGGGGAGT